MARLAVVAQGVPVARHPQAVVSQAVSVAWGHPAYNAFTEAHFKEVVWLERFTVFVAFQQVFVSEVTGTARALDSW